MLAAWCCRPVPRLSSCDVPDRPRPHQQQTAATASNNAQCTMHRTLHAQPSLFRAFPSSMLSKSISSTNQWRSSPDPRKVDAPCVNWRPRAGCGQVLGPIARNEWGLGRYVIGMSAANIVSTKRSLHSMYECPSSTLHSNSHTQTPSSSNSLHQHNGLPSL